MRVIISGGGTGGHIFPAIAIADALKAADEKIEILFVGAEGRMEMQKVPQAGYKIVGLNVVGFQRKPTLKNLLFPFKLVWSMVQAMKVVQSFKPDIAIGVGGYASGPILKAASWMKVKTVIQEQNSYAGVTNKLLGAKAQKIYVAYKGMDAFFDKNKIVLSGNPVRKDICEMKGTKEEARMKLGLSDFEQVVLISGGSLGARTINEAVEAHTDRIANMPNVCFYWQVGRLYLQEFSEKKIASLPNVKMVAFIDDMPAAYTAADVVVGRAGAGTISELCIVARPAILVPSPNVAEDHQTHNARALADVGAAVLVRDDKAGQTLVDEILNLLKDSEKRKNLSTNIQKMALPNAAEMIAEGVIRLVREDEI